MGLMLTTVPLSSASIIRPGLTYMLTCPMLPLDPKNSRSPGWRLDRGTWVVDAD